MKQTKILFALMMLAVFGSCNDEFVDNTNSRHISINACMPDMTTTRAIMYPKENTLDMLMQWTENDYFSIYVQQEGNIYEVNRGGMFGFVIPISSISENRKSCTFDFDLPKEIDINKHYTLFGCCRIEQGAIDVEGYVTFVDFMAPQVPDSLWVPLYFIAEKGDDLNRVEFKHLTTYEVLHIQNSSQQDIKFHFEGEAFNVDERWYYDFFWINLPTFQIQGSNENFGPVNTDEEDLVIKAGESKIFLTNYAPTGKKIKNARLNAVINGQKISSTNTLSSDVELEIGKAYHMYATWDGKELKFGKEDIRETIIYPTSSYQLSEDGKTLVKWLGEETEIDMSADPAFDEVEIIGYKAFAWSTAKTIKLSNKAKEIEQWAFNYASTKKIYLPKSITTIAYEAFAKCTDLEEVHITDLSAWCKIRFTDAWSNPFTYASSLFVNNDKIVDLVIPDDIDKIGKYTFRGADIETVTMSDNVTDIGEDAFSFCENLKRIQFSSNLAVIDYCAFRGCKSLEEVWLPESLNYLGDMSFDLCNKIRTVYIGKNLHYIGFSFRCSNLENFIVSNQNKYLFAVDGILYSNVFKYSTETNDYILDHASLTCYPGGRSDNSYTLPDFAIYIQDFAFMQSKNLTTVILHSGMTEIGSLNYLFNETEVPNLNKVIIYATTPPSSYSGHSGTHSYEYGYGINPHTTLYVPSESVDTYKADENWGKFGTILPLGSGMPDDDADVIDDDPAEDPFGD